MGVRLKATRAMTYRSRRKRVGDEFDASDMDARILVATRQATIVDPQPPGDAKPKARRAGQPLGYRTAAMTADEGQPRDTEPVATEPTPEPPATTSPEPSPAAEGDAPATPEETTTPARRGRRYARRDMTAEGEGSEGKGDAE